MNTVVRITVLLTALFLAVGGFCAWRGWLDTNTYIVLAGLIGSVASVIGLIGLAAPRITAQDVRDVEADLLKDLSDTIRSVRDYEAKASASRMEIDRLAQERAEIVLLVRQASLKAFMEERLRYIALELDKKIDADITLKELLSEYKLSLDRVSEINANIERSERADLIQRVLADIHPGSREKAPKILIRIAGNTIDIGPALSMVGRFGRLYVEAVQRAFGVAISPILENLAKLI
jgi:hypothetical protein